MWITDFITKNSFQNDSASVGEIAAANTENAGVLSTTDRFNVKRLSPYGVAYVPPKGEKTVVMPTDGGGVMVGIISNAKTLEEGEVMLYSSGGATLVLKNDGRILANGKEIG